MNSKLNNSETLPVSQETERDSEMEIWEPPFERWMRIADLSLHNAAFPHFEVAPRPQTFAPAHRN
jgi:hypothetical protein